MFFPMALTVSPGATISVTKKDSATHFDSDERPVRHRGRRPNQTKTFKAPMQAGTYHYICNIHQYMVGSVTVK
jgi:plastocyanin